MSFNKVNTERNKSLAKENVAISVIVEHQKCNSPMNISFYDLFPEYKCCLNLLILPDSAQRKHLSFVMIDHFKQQC